MLYVNRYLQAKLRPVGQEHVNNIGISVPVKLRFFVKENREPYLNKSI